MVTKIQIWPLEIIPSIREACLTGMAIVLNQNHGYLGALRQDLPSDWINSGRTLLEDD